MSACRPEELEAAVMGELPAARAALVLAHAQRCVSCGHELSWLRAEQALFAARASDGRPAFTQPEPFTPHRPRVSWGRVALGIAASAALGLLPLWLFRAPTPTPAPEPVARIEVPRGSEWSVSSVEERQGACLVATPSDSARCGVLASTASTP